MTKFILLTLCIVSSVFAGNFGAELSLIGQLPKGEFKDEGVPTGLGLDFNGLWYPTKEMAIGLNLGGTQYGSSKRQIPFSYFTDLITITEKTTNNIGYGHLLCRVRPFSGNIRPYFEGLLGLKNLSTTTELFNENCIDNSDTNYDDCEIASSTNSSDYAFSYGGGGGLEITLTSIGNEESDIQGILSFYLNARYMMGAEAEYLKEGSITFTNPTNGPVQTSFNQNKSKTDVLQISIGLHFDITSLEF